jgi:lipopolysaccharide export system protein LptC
MTPPNPSHNEIIWRPRETSVAESVVQYSRFVGIMKMGLPIVAGFLLLLIIVLPLIRREADRFQVGSATINAKDGTLSMTNARYYGTDDKGQPYNVTASGVLQKSAGDTAIDLNAPKAEINMNNGTWMSATASTGTYNREKQVLDLSGDVSLFHHTGNDIHTDQAQVRLKDGMVTGNGDVHGEGPVGTINAKGFTYSKDDKKLRLTGPARLTFKSKSAETTPEAKQ